MKDTTTTFEIYFDGGTHHNHLDGYGSWEVRWLGFSKKSSRVQFRASEYGQRVTNNVAEYLSLGCALIWIQSVKDKGAYRIKIHGDSQLVLNTLSGRYRTHKAHLKILRDQARELLKGFAGYKTEWQPRQRNVERFGH